MLKRLLVVGLAVGLSAAVACAGGAPAGGGGGGAAATATPRPGGGPGTTPTGGGALTGDAEAGKNLFVAKGCTACHTVESIPSARGTIGPDLTKVATKDKIVDGRLSFNDADLDKWLTNPPSVKPDTQMPNLSLSDTERKQLIAFLKTLK